MMDKKEAISILQISEQETSDTADSLGDVIRWLKRTLTEEAILEDIRNDLYELERFVGEISVSRGNEVPLKEAYKKIQRLIHKTK